MDLCPEQMETSTLINYAGSNYHLLSQRDCIFSDLVTLVLSKVFGVGECVFCVINPK